LKILLDECVDWRLLRELPEHEVKTVRQMGWSNSVNGDLLRLAQSVFDVFITTDKNLSFQQNVTRFEIAVITLSGRSDRLRHLRELIPQLLILLPGIQPGEVRIVSWRDVT
jgi:predicted nuclease of predicted toxin-antitoxin system